MSNMYKTFKNDPEAEKKGVVLDYGSFRVTVARAGGANKRFQKTLERRTQPYQRAMKTGTMDDQLAEDLLMETYADTILLDWEVRDEEGDWHHGIDGPDGDVLPVTKENLLLTFKNLPDLYADIREQAAKGILFRAALREEAAKNS